MGAVGKATDSKRWVSEPPVCWFNNECGGVWMQAKVQVTKPVDEAGQISG